MAFDESFIEALPDNPELAGKEILDALIHFHKNLPGDEEVNHYDDYLRTFTLLCVFAESHGIYLPIPLFSVNVKDNILRIVQFFSNARAPIIQKFASGNTDKYKTVIERKFGKRFHYQFSDGDIKRIQVLINELREIIKDTESLDIDHRTRLLKRLEKLQSELHKTVSDLDRFWGLLIEGSIVLKKIGENAKPIVDRIQEIINIVWRVQARAEELPSNVPLELPSSENDEKNIS